MPDPQYAIYAGSGEKEALAPRSLGRHRDLEVLQLRLTTTPEERREEIRERWGLPSVEVYKASERARALRQLIEGAGEEEVAEAYRTRLQGIQQRVESAEKLEPITYPAYLEQAVQVIFALDTVDVDTLDAGTVRRAIEDFLLDCEGTSREEVERLQSTLSGSLRSLLQGTETAQNGTSTTPSSPR